MADPRRLGAREVYRSLGRPRVLMMLVFGFSSGLPFLLTGNTLGFWLREGGIELTAIGFLSWVGLAYSLKFLWAPIIDKVDAPIFGRRLGRRRGWMLLSQLVIGGSLFAMSAIGPAGGLGTFAGFALAAAFASATQDIVLDAWRIERAEGDEDLALLTAAFQLGYRAAILATDALILLLASRVGWASSYAVAALAMSIGVAATFAAREGAPVASAVAAAPLWTPRGLADAVLGPFIAFFRTHGALALLMLAAISLYRLGDFVMGPMANPFYVDLGLSKDTVGAVRATVGLWASVIGTVIAGLSAVRFGFGKTLVFGAIIGPASNLGFTAMALAGPDLTVFSAAMAIDNFSTGFAGTALVAYMSSLTNVGYTATQYALLSSFYALLGKFLKGFSGAVVESLPHDGGVLDAYAVFFFLTAVIGAPSVVLSVILARRIKLTAA